MDPIKYSEALSSETLNKHFNEVHTMLGSAFRTNQQLNLILKAQQAAIDGLGLSMGSAAAKAGSFLDNVGFNNSSFNGQRVASDTFWEQPYKVSGMVVEPGTGHIRLQRSGDYVNRVPLNDSFEIASSVSAKLRDSNLIDNTVHWMLEPARFWATRLDQDKVTIQITLPPTQRSEVNHIVLENLYPTGIKHTIKVYDSFGSAHVAATDVSESALYAVNGYNFGGRITITLTSTLKDSDGKYLFGIKNLKVGYQQYVESGYAISRIPVNTSGPIVLRSFHAAPQIDLTRTRFIIGTGIDSSDAITGQIYDSRSDLYPFLSSSPGISGGTLIAEADGNYYLYIRTEMIATANGNSPVLNGFYFEYDEGI